MKRPTSTDSRVPGRPGAELAGAANRATAAPLPAPLRAFFGTRFAHDFSSVRLHTDAAAAASARRLGVEAFARGSDVFFAAGRYAPQQRHGLSVLAHELAHIVQQSGAGRPGADAATAERGAASAAHSVLADAPAAATRSVLGTIGGPRIAGFGSTEHEMIGNDASGGASVEIVASGPAGSGELLQLAYGDLVALVGDYFESAAQIRLLSRIQSGRDQIRWARWWAYADHNLAAANQPNVTDDVKTEVKNRYYTLAARNFSHFAAGGTAKSTYHDAHYWAVEKAVRAGLNDDSALLAEAIEDEAGANHYLTDMFSAGHVRTQRQNIKAWYQQHFPSSLDQFVRAMAVFVAAKANVPFVGPDRVEAEIRAMGGPALASFSLGDIVSLALHNADNLGLDVVADVDASGKSPASGDRLFHYRAVGDGQLHAPDTADVAPSTTKNMATAAARVSLGEVRAFYARAKGLRPAVGVQSTLVSTLMKDLAYGAERYLPREETRAGNRNVTYAWEWGAMNAAARDAMTAAIRSEIVPVIREKAAVAGKKAIVGGQLAAAINAFADQLNAQGIAAIESAIGVPASPAAATP